MADSVKIDFEGNFDKLQRQLLGIGAAVAGAFAFKEMIAAAIESEDAINRLNIALQQQGTYTEEASQSFQAYAANLQATTGYSDDLITSNASLLVSIGKLSGEGLERATDAALDLAAATGKDLNTTFDLLAKAAAGNTGSLSRYGIIIDESIPKSQRFAEALKQIESQMGGMAEGRLNTFSGALTRLQLGFGDVLEEIGKLFTKSPLLREILNYIASGFEKAAKSIEAFGKGGDFVQMLAQSLIDVGRIITQYILPPLELVYNIMEIVFNAMRTYLQLAITQWSLLAEGIGKIGNAVGLVSDESLQSLTMFRESAQAQLGAFADETKQSFTDGLNFDASVAADNYLTSMEEFVNQTRPATDAARQALNPTVATEDGAMGVGEAFSATLAGMSDAAKEFAKTASENFKKVGASMFQSLGNAAGQAFAAFGKAIAKGENAFQAFINSLVASMGHMAIQLGTQFILQGIAYSWAGMPNGPALMAAGAALAAFGGILSAVGGGGGETSGASTGAASGGSGSGLQPSGSEGLDTLEERKANTSLVVNVQGNILDRRQTGLEIAEVIQETFGSNGIVFST